MQYFYLLLSLIASTFLFGQTSVETPYFQQEVNFNIDVSLDDEKHELQGQWRMEYTNYSPDELDFIYIHLWPNAFSTRTTAFAKQKLDHKSTKFYFADEKDLGYIDSLSFQSNGKTLVQQATKIGPDVIKILLHTALIPGETIIINSPFRVKIPASFSRLGHVGQSYQITQWYPKPAVYDREGWHPIPYLDAGEFYSEFGKFDVNITLPANYLVGATGELKNAEEREWLLEKAKEDGKKKWTKENPEVWEEMSFPKSDQTLKTLHYSGQNIHDFAWFADKRFYVLHDTIQLSGKTIDAWSFFTDREAHLWQNSMKYIKRSTRFYSEKVGAYPYPQITALQSALSAGGGMEYPMVTVIGLSDTDYSLDEVIAHEVGHNWFYGVLASNERDHAWMDEGFNSYYEQRYTSLYYEQKDELGSNLNQGSHSDLGELAYRYFACRHLLKAPDTPSNELDVSNYWLGAYSIPSKAFQQLEERIGRDRLDAAMQAYFNYWKFKHPQPIDAQSSLEKALGEPLDWLFGGFIKSEQIQDYTIRSVEKDAAKFLVKIDNKGKIAGPFTLTATNKKGETTVQQIDGFIGKQSISLARGDYKNISIDPHHESIELNRKNNYWQQGIGRIEPLKVKLFSIKKDEKYSNLFLLPLLGFNEHDGGLIGLGAYNRTILPTPFEYAIIPYFGLKSKKITGLTAMRYRWWPNSNKVQEISLIANYRSFHFRTYKAESLPLAYQRFSPTIRVEFPKKGNWRRVLQLRHISLNEEDVNFTTEGVFDGTSKRNRQINELFYQLKRNWVLAPLKLNFTVEQSNYTDGFNRDQDYVKLIFEAKGKILYDRKAAFHWRFFGGLFLNNSLNTSTYTPANAFSLFGNGAADYRYDHLYFDRSATDGFLSQQMASRAGGFHTPVAANFGVGLSNSQMFSVNTSVDLPFTPFWLPIKPYLDAASFFEPNFDGGANQLFWNAGLAMEWLDGKIGIYLPLTGSTEIMDRLKEQGGIKQRLSFRFIIRDLSPWNWIDEINSL